MLTPEDGKYYWLEWDDKSDTFPAQYRDGDWWTIASELSLEQEGVEAGEFIILCEIVLERCE